MRIRLRDGLKGVGLAIILTASAGQVIACGGDDDGGTGSGSSSGSSGSSGSSDHLGGDGGTIPDSSDPDGGPVDGGSDGDAAPLPSVETPVFTPAPGSFTSSVPGGVQLATATPDATIYFTTDGTNPSTASAAYSGPINVSTTTTIRAIAVKDGFLDSAVAVGTYTITPPQPGQLSNVTLDPSTGTYPNAKDVTMSIPASEAPATICYTLDGSAPTCDEATAACTNGTSYSGGPLQVDAPAGGGVLRIRAIACKVGFKASANVSEAALSFKAATPQASNPPPGEVPLNGKFTLSTDTVGAGTTIHYRTDGANPNCDAPVSGAEKACAGSSCQVAITQNTTVKARACKPNYASSEIASFTYTVRVDTPTLDEGTYVNDKTVVPGPNASVLVPPDWRCYSTTGTTPACGATVGACASGSATPPTITVDNTTVTAVGCKVGFTESAPVSGTYHLTVGPISVTPTPAGGVFSPGGTNPTTAENYWNAGTATAFTLDTETNDTDQKLVKIRYSTDGTSVPSCAGNVGAGVTEVDKGTNLGIVAPFTKIRAIGCKADYAPSAPRTLSYADTTQQVQLDALPSASTPTTSNNDIKVMLTSTPAAGTTSTTTHICYNVGTGPIANPDCNPVGNPSAPQGLCTAGTRYNPAAPFSVTTTGVQLKAIACKSGVPLKSSPIDATFTLKLGSPTATDSAGPGGAPITSTVAYGSTFFFHSSSEPSREGKIEYHYTTNGVNPTCSTGTLASSVTFSPPNYLPVTYKVIACDTENKYVASEVATLSFAAILTPPTFSPNGGTTANVASTTISSAGAEGPQGYLCVTTDNSTPACIGGGSCTGSKIANGASIGITTDQTTVKAVACQNTDFFSSEVATSNQFRLVVADPTVTPGSSTLGTPVAVAISNGATEGATVCWTSDGSTISTTCTSAGAMTCQTRNANEALGNLAALENKATNFTLRVRACRAGFAASNLVTRNYVFTPYRRTITIDGVSSDWSVAENALPTENGERGYLSWDATYLYFGWQGQALTSTADRYFGVYLRAPTGPYTLTRDDRFDAETFGNDSGSMPQASGGANYHFFVRTDRSEPAGVSRWNGAAWIDGSAVAPVTCSHGGTLGSSDALVECRVTRASLGLDVTNAQFSLNGVITDAQSSVHHQWPYVGGAHGYFSGNISTNIPSDPALQLTGIAP
ncbi:MAG TPA: chitobiase/beta-hexosaminidase C-terminal domain-containing protein [Labilithrix sp.]|nr:chitobiase/beta-hexosaminidase C-terminal domain-containing protein [Labilithrix sp.]